MLSCDSNLRIDKRATSPAVIISTTAISFDIIGGCHASGPNIRHVPFRPVAYRFKLFNNDQT